MINRKIIFPVLFLLILLSASMGCGKARQDNPQAATGAGNRKTDIKVTFIELGSVNCIPCKMMQPVMKQIETEFGGQVKVVFHDVWTEAGKPYAYQYQIKLIPTQVFLDAEDKEYFRHEGFFPFAELVKVLKQKGVK